MTRDAIGPYYPCSVMRAREVDALPKSGSLLIVGTWAIARLYRRGIEFRRGVLVAQRTIVVSMGARDVLDRISNSMLPVVIAVELRGYAPLPLLARLDAVAAKVNATCRLIANTEHNPEVRPTWAEGLPWR